MIVVDIQYSTWPIGRSQYKLQHNILEKTYFQILQSSSSSGVISQSTVYIDLQKATPKFFKVDSDGTWSGSLS